MEFVGIVATANNVPEPPFITSSCVPQRGFVAVQPAKSANQFSEIRALTTEIGIFSCLIVIYAVNRVLPRTYTLKWKVETSSINFNGRNERKH